MANDKVIIVLPAYNAAQTIKQTVDDIPRNTADEIILVDDGSHDETIKLAKELGLTIFQHKENTGYGGNQKTCYRLALEHGADIIAMLHPDYQYDPKLLPPMIEFIRQGYFDMVLGSRIRSRKEALDNGMPIYKYFSNRFLSLVENLATGHNLSEWHTGMRVYSRKVLESIPFQTNSDDFVFDTEVLFQVIAHNLTIGELSVPVRYMKEASSINFKRSMRYGLGTLGVIYKYLTGKYHAQD